MIGSTQTGCVPTNRQLLQLDTGFPGNSMWPMPVGWASAGPACPYSPETGSHLELPALGGIASLSLETWGAGRRNR